MKMDAIFLCPEGGATPMKTYKVTITETLQKTVDVAAHSRHEAEHLAEKQWSNSEHILNAEHFTDVSFTAIAPNRNRGMER
jgi:hypothetical protein